jgi:hypothetical protein
LIVKRLGVPLSVGDLERLNAAELDESAAGDKPTGKAEKVGQVYKEVYGAFSPGDLADQRLAGLAATDADMPRIVEDMWQVLIDKGLVADEDLPQASQDKLANRRTKRAAL